MLRVVHGWVTAAFSRAPLAGALRKRWRAMCCPARLGPFPYRRPYCHEMALRILLASLEQHAARYKRYIKPVLSLSIDFYIRVFVRVYTSGAWVGGPCILLLLALAQQGTAGKEGPGGRLHSCIVVAAGVVMKRRPFEASMCIWPHSPVPGSFRGEEQRGAAGIFVAEHRLRQLLLAARGPPPAQEQRRQRQVHARCALPHAVRGALEALSCHTRWGSSALERASTPLPALAARLRAGAGPAVPQQCPETGSGFQMGGPFWAEPLHDQEWVQGLLQQVRADKDV